LPGSLLIKENYFEKIFQNISEEPIGDEIYETMEKNNSGNVLSFAGDVNSDHIGDALLANAGDCSCSDGFYQSDYGESGQRPVPAIVRQRDK
jgi:hypothetical protein